MLEVEGFIAKNMTLYNNTVENHGGALLAELSENISIINSNFTHNTA